MLSNNVLPSRAQSRLFFELKRLCVQVFPQSCPSERISGNNFILTIYVVLLCVYKHDASIVEDSSCVIVENKDNLDCARFDKKHHAI
jgi:hypothetical protein